MNTQQRTIADLVVPPEGQREKFDPATILDLAQSIDKNGLIHPVLLRQDGQTVVAGRRRLLAIAQHMIPFNKAVRHNNQVFPVGTVPVTIAVSDDPLDLEELELAENIDREDLTWAERAKTVERLHKLRQAQKTRHASTMQDAGTHPFSADIVQTPADTAREVFPQAKDLTTHNMGYYLDTVQKQLIVARHLDKPEVAKAPDLKTAFKVIKKLEETERDRLLARAVGDTYKHTIHEVYHADCLELMDKWWADPQGPRFDVILTDPPYGMGADEFGDAAGRLTGTTHEYKDDTTHFQILMARWTKLSFEVAKPQAHAYVWCDIDKFHWLRAAMQDAGWYVFRTPLTNFKRNSGRVPIPEFGIRRQSEWCLFAIKGKMPANMIRGDVITTDSDEQMVHGAQKPVALYEDLLERSVKPGMAVLDSFGGTGTLIPACHKFKCKAVVIEQDEGSYGKCLRRVEELGAQQELPT